MDYYESQQVLSQYLLFHYGKPEEVLPYDFGPHNALNYPVNSVNNGMTGIGSVRVSRALDLGCSVGRSTFELANYANEVIGVDYSKAFIGAASDILEEGELVYDYQIEGDITQRATACRPDCAAQANITFETGDAMNLRDDIGSFELVHMANLIDRLDNPEACLQRLPHLVEPGGVLIIASPYSWLEEFTPKQRWIGGILEQNRPVHTLEGLERHLSPDFQLEFTADQPFLIRLHARRFEWSVAQISRWSRTLK